MYKRGDRECKGTAMKMASTVFVVLALFALANGAIVPVPRFAGRIVGGEPTTIEEHPYQLSLMYYDTHICGASIISANWALTAAHCIDFERANLISLRAGSSIMEEGGSEHHAERLIPHSLYDGKDYDYALVRVKTPFPLGQPGVAAIKLASSEPEAGETAVVSGWGTLSAGGDEPSQLQVVEIPVISRDTCQNMYSRYKITDRMICAASENGGKDSCQGDSGGPMIVNGVQTGVVSWGIGCANAKYPGVYANVANQLGWIQSHTDI